MFVWHILPLIEKVNVDARHMYIAWYLVAIRRAAMLSQSYWHEQEHRTSNRLSVATAAPSLGAGGSTRAAEAPAPVSSEHDAESPVEAGHWH